MKKYNFKKVEVNWIDGKPLDLGELKINELIGNALHTYSMDVNVARLWVKIYDWEEVELRAEDISKMKEIIRDEKKFAYIPLIARAVIEYIDSIKE